jgi:hypothetical protein
MVGTRDRFLRILAAVVADPECPLAELPLADPVRSSSDAKRAELLRETRRTRISAEERRAGQRGAQALRPVER